MGGGDPVVKVEKEEKGGGERTFAVEKKGSGEGKGWPSGGSRGEGVK